MYRGSYIREKSCNNQFCTDQNILSEISGILHDLTVEIVNVNKIKTGDRQTFVCKFECKVCFAIYLDQRSSMANIIMVVVQFTTKQSESKRDSARASRLFQICTWLGVWLTTCLMLTYDMDETNTYLEWQLKLTVNASFNKSPIQSTVCQILNVYLHGHPEQSKPATIIEPQSRC